MKNKLQVLAHQKELNKVARYHESSLQTARRILAHLHRPNPLYNIDGTIKDVVTIRAYLLKYDRKEYRHLIRAVAYNMQSHG